MKNETALMIRSIQFVLANKSEGTEYSLENINWRQFSEMSSFHSIRPILYQFLKNKIDNKELELLKDFSINQTFINLQYIAEIKRLLNIFNANGVPVLPYKGVLFIHELYKNEQLREVGDIDLLFRPEDAKKGMQILLNEGYKFVFRNERFDDLTVDEKISVVLASKNQNEVSFQKDNFEIDFHWDYCYGFLPYEINYNGIFENANVGKFFGFHYLIPSVEDIFFMLLIHHGGKENWIRLKHFADLIMFIKTYGYQLDWKHVIKKAQDFRIERQLLMGFYLTKKYFQITIPEDIAIKLLDFKPKSEKITIAYWDESKYWDKLLPRLKYERILFLNQDSGFSFKKYILDFFNSYSTPNPIENNRVWIFSNKYPFLNSVSKILTYLIKKNR